MGSRPPGEGGSAAHPAHLILPAVAFLLPFEPRHGFVVLGFELTALEAAAGTVMLALLWSGRSALRALARRPPLPLLFLAAYAAAHLLSAAVTKDSPALAFRFALRMTAAAVFAWLVAAAPGPARRSALVALLASSSLVASLCVLEAAGVRSVDPLLDLFRGSISHVGGVTRATGGSENPNLAAAFLMTGLVICGGLGPWRYRGMPLWLASSGLLSTGLLFTYARGPLMAAAAGLVICVLTLRRREPRAARTALATLIVLIAVALAFLACTPAFGLRLAGSGTRAWYGVRYEPADEKLLIPAAESRKVALRLTNAGERSWIHGLRLCARWYDVDRKRLELGPCADLPAGLAPGEAFGVQLLLEAPGQAGRYFLIWDVLQEGSAWLSLRGVTPAVVPAIVPAGDGRPAPEWPSLDALPPVAALSATWPQELSALERQELWRVACAMWRDHPWLGIGPDNFRWLQGRYSGHAFPQTWVFSNNTFLEAAATTGALGLAALLGTFIATAARATAATSRPGSGEAVEAAVCLALTASLAIHGLVDYVLAFTGHYLFLGLLVGSVAGLDCRSEGRPERGRRTTVSDS